MRLLFLCIFPAVLPAATGSLAALPGSLTPDGLPSISRALYEDVQRYADSRQAGFLDWSPSGRQLLISTRFATVPQLHLVAMPGGSRRQLTFFTERIASAAFNPANRDEIVFGKDTGGDEFYQLYLLNRRDGKITLITDGGRSRNGIPRWSADGKRLVYSSTKRNGKDSDIWIVDPHSPAGARILMQADEPGWAVEDWSPDQAKLLAIKRKSATTAWAYTIDVATGKPALIGPDASDVAYFMPHFSVGAKGIFVLTNVGADRLSLGYVDLATRKLAAFGPAMKWELEDEFAVSQDHRYLAVLENEDGASRLHVIDTTTQADVKVPALPPGVILDLHWRNDSRELGFTLSSARSPGDIYSVRIGSPELTRWTESETGPVDASGFSEAQLIRWKSFDGLPISGFLFAPPAGKFSGPRPVIINIHGGPEGQSRPLYNGPRNYYVNELGIAMIYPNVRGSTGYGRKFLDADNGIKREDSVKDIGALLDWIKTQPQFDASRIMVTGGSYGGYMTLAVMTHYSDRVRCAVEQVGISNFNTFLQHTESYRRDARRVEYGDERDPQMRDFFETMAPLNNAQKITRPMFIVAGRNDPRVPWTEGKQMTEALRKNSVPTWFLIGEDEGHGFSKKPNIDYLFAATAQFIKQYLLD